MDTGGSLPGGKVATHENHPFGPVLLTWLEIGSWQLTHPLDQNMPEMLGDSFNSIFAFYSFYLQQVWENMYCIFLLVSSQLRCWL
jgi:hypothetical protein